LIGSVDVYAGALIYLMVVWKERLKAKVEMVAKKAKVGYFSRSVLALKKEMLSAHTL